MNFAPFGLTVSEWGVLLGLAVTAIAFVRWGFIPWLREAVESSIASDRGIRAAIQEVLKTDLDQVSALRTSVVDLTQTLGSTNAEHQATRRAFSDLQRMVHELRAMMETEIAAVKQRVRDVERAQQWGRRDEDRVEREVGG